MSNLNMRKILKRTERGVKVVRNSMKFHIKPTSMKFDIISNKVPFQDKFQYKFQYGNHNHIFGDTFNESSDTSNKSIDTSNKSSDTSNKSIDTSNELNDIGDFENSFLKLNLTENKNKIDDYDNKCLICYDNDKNLTSKFICDHKVCNECFSKQLNISKTLLCCFCRSDIDIEKFSDDEKNILEKQKIKNKKIRFQEDITEILISVNGVTGNLENNEDDEFPRYYPSWMNECIGNSSPILEH